MYVSSFFATSFRLHLNSLVLPSPSSIQVPLAKLKNTADSAREVKRVSEINQLVAEEKTKIYKK
jgi:hypothetical protein